MVVKASEYGTLPHTTQNLPKIWKPLRNLLIIGMACLVTVLFIYIYTYIHTYIHTHVTVLSIYIYIYIHIPRPPGLSRF